MLENVCFLMLNKKEEVAFGNGLDFDNVPGVRKEVPRGQTIWSSFLLRVAVLFECLNACGAV